MTKSSETEVLSLLCFMQLCHAIAKIFVLVGRLGTPFFEIFLVLKFTLFGNSRGNFYIQFFGNNLALFHLWWKETLLNPKAFLQRSQIIIPPIEINLFKKEHVWSFSEFSIIMYSPNAVLTKFSKQIALQEFWHYRQVWQVIVTSSLDQICLSKLFTRYY